ncbi:YccF domain-containing protein [Streptosporangium sp. NPDC004379]|uniref:YccF domain-containing protein n=1 Tax=Streptosporangium sp. NPDC004379 TaxID=3366189 RepID=UPI003683F576
MRTLLNVIWLVFAGIWMAAGYVLAGIICCVLIVTIPFGTVPRRPASRGDRTVLRFAWAGGV